MARLFLQAIRQVVRSDEAQRVTQLRGLFTGHALQVVILHLNWNWRIGLRNRTPAASTESGRGCGGPGRTQREHDLRTSIGSCGATIQWGHAGIHHLVGFVELTQMSSSSTKSRPKFHHIHYNFQISGVYTTYINRLNPLAWFWCLVLKPP